MSKYASSELNLFSPAEKDISSRAFQEAEEFIEFSSLPVKRSSGLIALTKDRIIASIADSLQKVLGISEHAFLDEAAADPALLSFKLDQANRMGKTDIRLIDTDGSIFWARLTKTEEGFWVEDIDIEKNFELDCEDLYQEQERARGSSEFCFLLQ